MQLPKMFVSNIIVELAKFSEDKLTGVKWAKLFSVEIIDDDGWRQAGLDFFKDEISLKQFCNFYIESTVNFD